MNTIASIIAANSGSLIIVLTLFLFGFTWLVATWKAKMESRAERIDYRMDGTDARLGETNARLGETNARLGETDARLDEMNVRLGGTDARLDEMNVRLGETNVRLDKVYYAVVSRSFSSAETQASPTRLSDYGEELAGKINAKEIADRYVTRMCEESKGMNPYQVQQHCFRFCMYDLLDDLEKNDRARFDEVADVAYQDGILIDYLTRVVGLILRDQVLAMSGKQPAADRNSPPSKPERGLAA